MPKSKAERSVSDARGLIDRMESNCLVFETHVKHFNDIALNHNVSILSGLIKAMRSVLLRKSADHIANYTP